MQNQANLSNNIFVDAAIIDDNDIFKFPSKFIQLFTPFKIFKHF